MQIQTSDQVEESKETELGLIPNSWDITRIDEIFHVKQGKQLSSKESIDGKIKKPFLRTSNVFWGKIDISKVDQMYFTNDEYETLKLQEGDILVCEGGDIGRTALYSDELEETAYQNHLHRLRPKDNNIDKKYFVLWMNHAINQRQMYIFDANRTTIPNLSASRLKSFRFPLPPIQEQQKISHVLSTLESAKEKTGNSINAFKELKKTSMKQLFTYGPVNHGAAGKIKLKETEVGEIPETWDVVEIGEVAKFQGGYAFKSKDYVKSGVRLFKISNVSFGKVLWDDVSYLPENYLEEYPDYLLRSGDLLMAMTRPIVSGGIKIARLLDKDCPSLLNQRVGRFIPKQGINLDFLFQILFVTIH